MEASEAPWAVTRAAELALERKAEGVLAMDLREISSATDFFVLATGTSDIQVKSIAEHIVDELKDGGVRPGHVEGMNGGRLRTGLRCAVADTPPPDHHDYSIAPAPPAGLPSAASPR